MLRHLPPTTHPDLLVGSDTVDDAAVWRRPDGRALVATTDFFTPIVDDAATWGAISATNAASDVFAMGGTPLFAMNIVAWPRDQLPLDLLGEVLAGATRQATAGGWVVVGGHTVDGPEPMFGQAVIGEVDPDRLMTNAGGRPGDALILTKPLGTGILATAIKRSEPAAVAAGGDLELAYRAGVAEMSRHNSTAARVARERGCRAATDVTGFGLAGHLHQMARQSGVGALIDLGAVPLLPDTVALIEAGHVPGGTMRNLDAVDGSLTGGSDTDRIVVADAQTSGGLLFACDPADAASVVDTLSADGHGAARIGELIAGEPGSIELVC